MKATAALPLLMGIVLCSCGNDAIGQTISVSELSTASANGVKESSQLDSFMVNLPPNTLGLATDSLQRVISMRNALRMERGVNTRASILEALKALRFFADLKATAYVCEGLDNVHPEVQLKTLSVLSESRDATAVPKIRAKMRIWVASEEASLSGGEESASRLTLLRAGIKTIDSITGGGLTIDGMRMDFESIKRVVSQMPD